MHRFRFPVLLLLAIILCLAACSRQEETGLEGTILFADQPIGDAQVEVYLRGEKDRGTQPFTAVATDATGRYYLPLPPGRYFLIGKKKEETADGRTRMLMGDCPANPLEVTKGITKVPPFAIREMGRDGALVATPGTGVRGRLTVGGAPVTGAFVYVYTETAAGLMGPSYGTAVRTDEDGSFSIGLPPGRFYLAARRRADGARAGEPAAGDLNGAYAGNPVEIRAGEILQLGDFPLAAVEAAARRERMEQGKFAPTGTAFSGRLIDQDGKPQSGLYVFAYLDSRMTGKPTYISAPTGSDGHFLLHLGDSGTYYVGARSAFGGPLEPGERVGTYDVDPRHAAAIEAGERRPLGDIVVREVW